MEESHTQSRQTIELQQAPCILAKLAKSNPTSVSKPVNIGIDLNTPLSTGKTNGTCLMDRYQYLKIYWFL